MLGRALKRTEYTCCGFSAIPWALVSRYAHGKVGVIERDHGVFVFPAEDDYGSED